MQQTEKYKLNLIESSDPFSPDGLNENTRKLETVVSETLERMDARVTVLEGFKFHWGGVKIGSDQNPYFLKLPFRPKVVLLVYTNTGAMHVLMSADADHGRHQQTTFHDDGIEIRYMTGNFAYMAFG